MPWELTIVNAQDRSQPLGTREEVIARVAAALPGVVMQEAPGPNAEFIAQMPPSLREHFLRPRQLQADFENGDFSMQFYATNEPEIMTIGVEVRGDGNPLAPLAAICEPNGWAVMNDADDTAVDLTAKTSADWETFRAWRDSAVQTLRSRGLTRRMTTRWATHRVSVQARSLRQNRHCLHSQQQRPRVQLLNSTNSQTALVRGRRPRCYPMDAI